MTSPGTLSPPPARAPFSSDSRTPPPWTHRVLVAAGVFGLAGVVLALLGATTHADHDMYHQMALFREVLRLGEVPTSDLFAYTPTISPSVHHEWGTGAVLYALAVGAGLGGPGVMLLKCALLAGLVAAAVGCARLRGARTFPLLLCGTLACALLLLALHTVRAQLFTLCFVAILLLLLELDRRGARRWVWAWLGLFVLWVNLHGGFVAGAGLYALYTGEAFAGAAWRGGLRLAFARTWHLLLGGGTMAALLGVNPYGWAFAPHLWQALRMDRPFVAEWRPLAESGPFYLAPFLVSLLAVAYAGWRRGPRELRGIMLLGVTAVLACMHLRHLSIYGVVWLAYAPGYLSDLRPGAGKARGPVRLALALASVAVVAAVLGGWSAWSARFWEVRVPAHRSQGGDPYPAGAVGYLRDAAFEGNLMTPFRVGAYVSWHLYPAVKVSLDSRYEAAYRPGVVETHQTAYMGQPGWEAAVGAYPTDAILVSRTAPLYRLLVGRGGRLPGRWRRVYVDDAFAVFAAGRLAPMLAARDRTGEAVSASFP